MLKKECCKKCWNKIHIVNEKIYGWTKLDEKNWNKKGIVGCPEKYIGEEEKKHVNYIIRQTTDKPPEHCPFILEHVI